jgi:hypothetical protein
MDDARYATAVKLRALAEKIKERDKTNREGTTSCQRLHAKEMPLALEALNSWADELESY